MSDTRIVAPPNHPARIKLDPYPPETHLKNLSLGIDNIHYDVFLSPRFVEFTRKYLLDLIRQTVNVTLIYGKNLKKTTPPEHAAFRRLLTEVLEASITKAKILGSVEPDILHNLALLKFVIMEIG